MLKDFPDVLRQARFVDSLTRLVQSLELSGKSLEAEGAPRPLRRQWEVSAALTERRAEPFSPSVEGISKVYAEAALHDLTHRRAATLAPARDTVVNCRILGGARGQKWGQSRQVTMGQGKPRHTTARTVSAVSFLTCDDGH